MLSDRFKHSYDVSENFRFGVLDEENNLVPEKEKGIRFVLQNARGNILSYASGYRNIDPHDGHIDDKVGELSFLEGIDKTSGLVDMEGNKVTRDNLDSYKGYDNYKGRRGLLNLKSVEALNEEVFKELIGYIQKCDYEIIELETGHAKEMKLFDRLGFKQAGIMDKAHNNSEVMIWNNPKFYKTNRNLYKQI